MFVFSPESQVITQLKEQGLNTELYYKNKDMGETFNIVPTSAIRLALDFLVFQHITRLSLFGFKIYHVFSLASIVLMLWFSICFSGEGIPDLLLLLIQWSQKTMVEKLTFRNEVQASFIFYYILTCRMF